MKDKLLIIRNQLKMGHRLSFAEAMLLQRAIDVFVCQAGSSPVIPEGLVGCGENCWSCGKYFTYEQHSECDGYCPHCNSPVDLDDEEDQPSKVVPTNPTEEMISNAWREVIGKCDHETIKRIYATMLAAAPQLPGSELAAGPGGWIPVSERMPDVGVKVLCFPVKDEPIHATFNGQLWLQDVSWSGSEEPIDNVIPVTVTHWMPLPAAPQEVIHG